VPKEAPQHLLVRKDAVASFKFGKVLFAVPKNDSLYSILSGLCMLKYSSTKAPSGNLPAKGCIPLPGPFFGSPMFVKKNIKGVAKNK
jgi:hypothetical protein